MNSNNLKAILNRYCSDEKFTLINNIQNDESYKWKVASEFKKSIEELYDLNDHKIAEKILHLKKITYNLIDSSSFEQPLYGLYLFAQKEPLVVKEMLINLFKEDGGDLKKRHEKIMKFIDDFNSLKEKYEASSKMYTIKHKDVMNIMFLNDPDNHYMYKSTEAHKFADAIYYFNDWGSGNNFDLHIYYKMCDWIVEHIKKDELLLKINNEWPGRKEYLQFDKNYHILAFDIIFCTSAYHLYDNIPVSWIDTEEKKDYLKRILEASKRKEKYSAQKVFVDQLLSAEEYFLSRIKIGAFVRYQNKEWKVVDIDNNQFWNKKVSLENAIDGVTKKLGLCLAISNNLLNVDDDDYEEMQNKYRDVMHNATTYYDLFKKAEADLEEYRDYLEE